MIKLIMCTRPNELQAHGNIFICKKEQLCDKLALLEVIMCLMQIMHLSFEFKWHAILFAMSNCENMHWNELLFMYPNILQVDMNLWRLVEPKLVFFVGLDDLTSDHGATTYMNRIKTGLRPHINPSFKALVDTYLPCKLCSISLR